MVMYAPLEAEAGGLKVQGRLVRWTSSLENYFSLSEVLPLLPEFWDERCVHYYLIT